MKILSKLPVLLALLAISAFAQSNPGAPIAYGVSVVASLSGTASVVTVQGNMQAGVPLIKHIGFTGFDVTCSVACTVSLERDGSAATTTTQAIVTLNGELGVSTALAFSSSNVGAGTVLAQYSLQAGGQIAVNMTGKFLNNGAENLTVRTSAITGTVNTNIQWQEK